MTISQIRAKEIENLYGGNGLSTAQSTERVALLLEAWDEATYLAAMRGKDFGELIKKLKSDEPTELQKTPPIISLNECGGTPCSL